MGKLEEAWESLFSHLGNEGILRTEKIKKNLETLKDSGKLGREQVPVLEELLLDVAQDREYVMVRAINNTLELVSEKAMNLYKVIREIEEKEKRK